MTKSHGTFGAQERRKISPAAARSSSLPVDFTRMVTEVLTAQYTEGLALFQTHCTGQVQFHVDGAVFPDEVLLRVSLIEDRQLSANTVFASCDFDSKASMPTVQDLLAAEVDAVGAVLDSLLDPAQPQVIEQLSSHSLASLEDAPYDWTEVAAPGQPRLKIWVRIDKSNPLLETLAEDWLAKNDPAYQKQVAEEEEQTQALFVTGPKRGSPQDSN